MNKRTCDIELNLKSRRLKGERGRVIEAEFCTLPPPPCKNYGRNG